MYLETLNIDCNFKFYLRDLVHFETTIGIRLLTAATKYGYYSPEHLNIIKNVRIG
jgi:hypothetical protein